MLEQLARVVARVDRLCAELCDDLHDILRMVSGTAHERSPIIMTALDVFAAREGLPFVVTGPTSAPVVTAMGEAVTLDPAEPSATTPEAVIITAAHPGRHNAWQGTLESGKVAGPTTEVGPGSQARAAHLVVQFRTTTSTRRFALRPPPVASEATGRESPLPSAVSRVGLAPERSIRDCLTAAAWRSERCWL
jgi:hypothetical protein